MKQQKVMTAIPLLTLIVMLVASPAFAQPPADAPVLIGEHPYDPEATRDEISNTIAAGYLPVGLEVVRGESFTVLYVDNDQEQVQEWFIHEFDELETLEEDMNLFLDDGWRPADVSYSDGSVFVLMLDVGPEIDGWRIHAEPYGSPELVEQTIGSFADDGFSVWGTSLDEGLVWYLFLNESDRPRPRAVSLESYEGFDAEIQSGLESALEDGWWPWSLLSEPGGETVTITYTAEVLLQPLE